MIDRDSDLHPPFCRRSLLVGANGGAVDHLDVAIVGGGDGVHQPVPYTCLPPSHEAVVAGGARAVALGQVAPWCAGSQHPEDAVQHAPVIDARDASGLIGQERLDHAPLEVGQIISAHADAESVLLLEGKSLGSNRIFGRLSKIGNDLLLGRQQRISNKREPPQRL